jgi:predicted Zn finger-like uncharacterized protein
VKISCPTCAAKYSVADEKIQSRLAKIRCRKCSSTIVIDGMTTPASVYIGDPSSPLASGPPPEAATSDAAAARAASAGFSNPAPAPSEPVGPAADEYAVDIADNDQRNMTIHQIVGAYNEGLISADTYIWKEGMADWQTLAEVKAVADALHAAAARPAAAAPAAVRRPDHGAAADLFGRIASAGGEDDITTSAPEPSFSAGTGARNESSVLFSLSALTGTGDTAAAPTGGSKRGRSAADDSGLIDLTALTASEGAGGGGGFGASASAYGASPLISAPLGGVSGPALGAGLSPGYGAPRSGGRTLVIAASLLVVAIIGGAALFVVNRGGDAEPTSSLEQAPAAAAEKAHTPEPAAAAIAPKPEPIAQEKATEPASVKDAVRADELPAAPEPVAKPPVVRTPPPAPKPRPSAATFPPARAKPPTPAPAAEPEPAPAPKPVASEPAAEVKKKPPVSRCECKPADLMCAMRCSAKNK